jgi:hypothetical protein
MRIEVLMAKNMKITLSLDMMPCNALHIYPNFRGTCYLQLQGGERGTDIVRGSTRTKIPSNPIEVRRIMKEYGAHNRFVFLYHYKLILKLFKITFTDCSKVFKIEQCIFKK